MPTADPTIKTEVTVRQPSLWKVILHNDDYTPMDFVTRVLTDIFNKPASEANDLMMTVHEKGRANVLLTTKEVANAKAERTVVTAAAYGYPLMATAEPA